MTTSHSEKQSSSVAEEQHLTAKTRIDLLTVAAIAIVAYLLSTIIHEALGHGLASLLLGLHPTRVTSVDLEVSFTGTPIWQVRFVAAAGCAANIIAALIVLALERFTHKASPATRYFLWLLATVNLLIPGGYLMVLSFAGFGDWHDFVQGISQPFYWQIGLTLLGVIISLSGLYIGVRTLNPFLGIDKDQRLRRARQMILVSYLAGSIVDTLAAVLNPTDPMLILISAAAASFGGTAFLLFIWRLVVNARANTAEVLVTPTRNWVWIGLGCAALLVYFVVLGPGLPR